MLALPKYCVVHRHTVICICTVLQSILTTTKSESEDSGTCNPSWAEIDVDDYIDMYTNQNMNLRILVFVLVIALTSWSTETAQPQRSIEEELNEAMVSGVSKNIIIHTVSGCRLKC